MPEDTTEHTTGQASDGGEGRHWDVGSVEDEAHRLIEAAGEWWRAQNGDSPPEPESPPHPASAGEPASEPNSSTGRASQAQHGPHERTETCTSCPWCRAKSAFGPVGADTFDSLADLLDAAAMSLRLLAHNRRTAARETPRHDEPEPGPSSGTDQPDPASQTTGGDQ